MAATFAWEFTSFAVRRRAGELDDVVVGVTWRLTASDGPHSVFAAGHAELGAADPSAFTPFEQVTRDMAVAWCEPQARGQGTFERLAQELAALAAPPEIISLPPPFGG